MAAKYLMIARDIEQQLRLLPADQRKLPTEAELCSRYNCSRQTIRSALALLEADGKIVKRRGSGSYLADSAGSREIALIIPDREEYLCPRLIRELRAALSGSGYSLQCYETYASAEREREILETLSKRKPAGILMEPIRDLYGTRNEDLLSRLSEVPFVYLGTRYSLPKEALCLRADDREGTYSLARWLSSGGHRQIAAILKADDSRGADRYRGLQSACNELGLSFREDNCLWYSQLEKQRLLDGSSELLHRFLRDYRMQCTAVVCFNDEIAYRLGKVLAAEKRPLTIVSFDNSYYASGESPFPSLGIDGVSSGARAASLLLELIRGSSPKPAPLHWTLYNHGFHQ